MSCTIFYKGKLKENTSNDMISSIIRKYTTKMDCIFHQDNGVIEITFNSGSSEPLVFDFNRDSIDSFCKWNGDSPKEFYQIFDLFIEIKPFFKSLKIVDDEGLWEEYITQNKPCKIQLRPLNNEKENQFLNRAMENSRLEYDEVEQVVFSALGLVPAAQAICRLIMQDFIQILKLRNKSDFDPEGIVAFTNVLSFADDHLGKAHTQIFKQTFANMMLQIWISYVFTYKNNGIVHQLSNEVRGLKSSKLAALFGVLSIFLNRHSGVVNGKHAEMKKMASKYYLVGGLGEVMVMGNEKIQLEFFVSMMDYLDLSMWVLRIIYNME